MVGTDVRSDTPTDRRLSCVYRVNYGEGNTEEIACDSAFLDDLGIWHFLLDGRGVFMTISAAHVVWVRLTRFP